MNRHTSFLCALQTYAHRLTNGNPQLAGKLLHETLSRLTERAAAYPPALIGFTTWAKIVMKSAFHETVENADLHELHHLAYRGTLSPMMPARDKEYTLLEQIQMMSRLTPHQAAATALRLKGYTHREIARQMGITTKCARRHLAQARQIIATAWDN